MTEQTPTQVHVVKNKDGSVTVMQPKGRKHHGVTVLTEPDEVFRNQVGGFVNFVREHAVVGLAVGFIIGLQAQTLVKQLVDSFVTPLLDFLFGKGLAHKQFTLHTGTTPVALMWGKFLYALVSFLAVLFFVYLVVKLFKLDKLDRPRPQKEK